MVSQMTKPKKKDWLKNLLSDLKKVDVEKDMTEIFSAIEANEESIGVITGHNTKGLLILALEYQEKFVELMDSMDLTAADDKIIEAGRKRDIAKLLMNMFWISVQSELGDAANRKSIALRENWTIVTYENIDESGAFFEELFGPAIIISLSPKSPCGPCN
jgi:hypothetical protein